MVDNGNLDIIGCNTHKSGNSVHSASAWEIPLFYYKDMKQFCSLNEGFYESRIFHTHDEHF